MQSAAEILKHALFNEVKASVFYNKAAEMTQDDQSRMVLLELSGMEDEHAQGLLEKVKNAPCADDFDAHAYLKQLESTAEQTISIAENELFKHGDMKSVLSFAFGLEKEAQQTYIQLSDQAVDQDVKKYCLELAQEEGRHANRVEQLISSLDMSEDDRPPL